MVLSQTSRVAPPPAAIILDKAQADQLEALANAALAVLLILQRSS